MYSNLSPSDIVEIEIANSRVKFDAIASYCGTSFDEANDQAGLALKYYTMYLLYVRSQSDNQGLGEYQIAMSILTELWGNSVKDYLEGKPQNDTVEEKVLDNQKGAVLTNIDYEDDSIEDWN